jgi:PhnB protein
MTVQATTHLNFRGQAREALEFYRSVFGGEQTVMAYGDFGAVQDPALANQVMWGQVVSERGFRIMAYDVQPEKPWNSGENAFYVALRGDEADEIAAYWGKLSESATILQPLGPSAWSPLYGMLKDRFGITWVMDVAGEH